MVTVRRHRKSTFPGSNVRQITSEDGHANTLFIHVTLAPVLEVVGEQKTKPTRHSVRNYEELEYNRISWLYDVKTPITTEVRRKISLFASVEENSVISCHDAPSVYKVPEILENQGLVKVISEKLLLNACSPNWDNWKSVAKSFYSYRGTIKINDKINILILKIAT